ncbi:UDP-N-acetylglucosamine 2-epimerase [Akkermansiaceae bacterium]|nr:UDP-N-acetylglucosamine 2-epimerase [Akkermansiaceae bacterium]
MIPRKIVFLTGTRADFGKLKSLVEACLAKSCFDVKIFVTGMHLQKRYGNTVDEIEKCGYPNVFRFRNHISGNPMDQVLGKTIEGFSEYVNETKPDLIVVHGDRVETLAGSIVGSLNNVLVAHIEGGEVSGTIDELIRHSVSKMSHIHFVSNDAARKRLIQMGEVPNSIFVIGSPDVDIMISESLPTIKEVKNHYQIIFKEYGVVLFHPVTTEFEHTKKHTRQLVDALLSSNKNFIVIYPNNDLGSAEILEEYKCLEGNSRFKIFPSIRFEFFLVLLKNAKCLVGNSSAGIREAPYYGLPAVDIGTRQQSRALQNNALSCGCNETEIKDNIDKAFITKMEPVSLYGDGRSDQLFTEALLSVELWEIPQQKVFNDILDA